MKKKAIEIGIKVLVAALTAFLTAITTTSCIGHGPLSFLDMTGDNPVTTLALF